MHSGALKEKMGTAGDGEEEEEEGESKSTPRGGRKGWASPHKLEDLEERGVNDTGSPGHLSISHHPTTPMRRA